MHVSYSHSGRFNRFLTLLYAIVVGAGPCGLSLSLALARAGIEVKLIDKEYTIESRPRAVHLTAPEIKYSSVLVSWKMFGALVSCRRIGHIENLTVPLS